MSARSVRMNPACSEANVVGLLSELKRKTLWTSSLPEGDLGEYVLSEYRSVGVDLSTLVRKPNSRIALYFMEPGEPPMPANVIYDREYTPFRTTGIDEYDGDTILDTRLIFLTGITAALTDTTADVVSFAADEAAKKGIDIALDVDFRSKLWSGEHARQVLEPIAKKARILFCAIKDAMHVFGIEGTGEEVVEELYRRFGNEYVVSTNHLDGPYLRTAEGVHKYATTTVPVVDRPGAGDSFVSATLHGFLSHDVECGVKWGAKSCRICLNSYG